MQSPVSDGYKGKTTHSIVKHYVGLVHATPMFVAATRLRHAM